MPETQAIVLTFVPVSLHQAIIFNLIRGPTLYRRSVFHHQVREREHCMAIWLSGEKVFYFPFWQNNRSFSWLQQKRSFLSVTKSTGEEENSHVCGDELGVRIDAKFIVWDRKNDENCWNMEIYNSTYSSPSRLFSLGNRHAHSTLASLADHKRFIGSCSFNYLIMPNSLLLPSTHKTLNWMQIEAKARRWNERVDFFNKFLSDESLCGTYNKCL